MKTCKDCGQEKPFGEFSVHGSGYRYYCKACEGITRADIERAFRAPVHEVVADGLLDDFLA